MDITNILNANTVEEFASHFKSLLNEVPWEPEPEGIPWRNGKDSQTVH